MNTLNAVFTASLNPNTKVIVDGFPKTYIYFNTDTKEVVLVTGGKYALGCTMPTEIEKVRDFIERDLSFYMVEFLWKLSEDKVA